MKKILLLSIITFSCAPLFAQLSAIKMRIIEEKSKPLERKNGFYFSSLRYLWNKPRYDVNVTAEKEDGNQNCQYYKFIIPEDSKYKEGKLFRKSSCFVADNQLYIATDDRRRAYYKVLVPGYYALLACNPKRQSNQLGLVGVLDNIGTYDHKNGTIMNLGTFQLASFNKHYLKRMLSNNKDLLKAYQAEEDPDSFAVMVDYLIKLNNEIMKDY